MQKPGVSLILTILLGFFFSGADARTDTVYMRLPDSILLSQAIPFDYELSEQVHQVSDEQKKKKLVSALFAFPFPFGFMGAHRVMLGCKPWVPVVYVATFGGCFGLVPLIDFCVILLSKDIEQYENNPNIFMWVK